MVRLVYLPTRLPSLVGPQPPADRRTAMLPPFGGAVPASTVISVAITSVTYTAVSASRYIDEEGHLLRTEWQWVR